MSRDRIAQRAVYGSPAIIAIGTALHLSAKAGSATTFDRNPFGGSSPWANQRSKLGRTALVQCALIAKRYSPYLDSYYERIRMRRGTGRAIIALARKFLGVIYRTLKNNWVFEDFPNFVLKEEVAA